MSDTEVTRASTLAVEAARVAWSSLRLLPAELCRMAIGVLIHEYERVHGRAFEPPTKGGRSR